MKTKMLFAAALAGAVFFSCKEQKAPVEELYSRVDPYIGAGGHGHVFVGASVPFGAVQAGPNNIHKGWDWCSGYHYSDSIIIGFSQTHLNGTGCSDMGDIQLMPYPGDVKIDRGEQDNIEGAYASTYSHSNEKVEPAYYSLLMDNGVKAELTATAHAAMHRYTFPIDQMANIMINLVEGNGDRADSTYIKLVDRNTIEGYRFSKGWSPRHKIFFAIKSNVPVDQLAVFDNDQPVEEEEGYGLIKGVARFEKAPSNVVWKIGISSVSCANAMENLDAEMPSFDFDSVVIAGKKLWEQELSRIAIKTSNERYKKIFYTSLYHTAIAPTRYSDVNGDFRGHDDKIYRNVPYTNYSTLSLWDTYRALNPLFTIIHPQMIPDIVNSMLGIYDQQGRLPIWPLAGGETNCMPGYSAIPVIADAYLKGFEGFDAERAFAACVKSATNPNQKGISSLMNRRYIPCDSVHEAPSFAMEYAVGDWGIAQMAKRMGKQSDYRVFAERANYFENYFDSSIGFIRPKMADGSWRTPYDPFINVHGRGDFCEGNGWQYTFFVPQNPEGLILLFGGDEGFTKKLDEFYVAEGDLGEYAAPDISGLIGQYAHGNEPSHHVAYLYAFAGQQWKIAEKVRYIMDHFYTDQPDGIIGNEDCGQMSAWYILSSMGFYQVNPCNGVFVFGSPLFDEVSITLPEDKTFIVEAINNGPENIYIQKVELNGKPYSRSYILYQDIMKGGKLTFYMGDKPNYDFGTAKEDRPVSLIFDKE
ncbi:GH92 family glycosyl hydrolase [Coprobacter fastidiosus]|uniref:GH92 family glycosyl hydrolase n=1 Tax=Coprobacter fastidiosus TaxID=1099853 RepID=UPI002675E1D0|nr:GH92 family glycosyl hydrolase [Coprobacter fastidiosus]